jgi:hypothetical protein
MSIFIRTCISVTWLIKIGEGKIDCVYHELLIYDEVRLRKTREDSSELVLHLHTPLFSHSPQMHTF